MIVILKTDLTEKMPEYQQVLDYLAHKPNIKTRVHQEIGTLQTLTEIYLIGDTASLDKTEIESLPGVDRVVRVSEEYRILGRHKDDSRPTALSITASNSARTISTSSPVSVPWIIRLMSR